MADVGKTHMTSGVVALVSTAKGKASLVVGVTKDMTDKISAADLVRAGAYALAVTSALRPWSACSCAR